MTAPPVYVVTGGRGVSGEQLARTTLAQFQGVDVPVIVVPHVRDISQIEAAVRQAASSNGTIVHTLVDTTDKPIEESADEVVAVVTRRLKNSGNTKNAKEHETD